MFVSVIFVGVYAYVCVPVLIHIKTRSVCVCMCACTNIHKDLQTHIKAYTIVCLCLYRERVRAHERD